MRLFISLIASFNLLIHAHAQQNHFIYIQSENKQAFYVKLNGKIFSSSAAGYTIISRLTDGDYRLTIGFPGNGWQAQMLSISVRSQDQGYLLKNLADKGWALFNLETMDLSMATAATTSAVSSPVKNKTDAFSSVLEEITNTIPVSQTDTFLVKTVVDSVKLVESTRDTKGHNDGSSSSGTIRQQFTHIDVSGRSMIYTVSNENGKDSITLFIPYLKEPELLKEKPGADNSVVDSSLRSDGYKVKDSIKVVNSTGVENVDTLPAMKPSPTDIKVSDTSAVANGIYKITVVNPACKVMATDDDFLKIRKKMAGIKSEDDMVTAAKKGFKNKCFTVDQVKNLSLLFIGDEGKYNFFDAAYSHVSDIGNFKHLQTQLTEAYYINRFKSMLR